MKTINLYQNNSKIGETFNFKKTAHVPGYGYFSTVWGLQYYLLTGDPKFISERRPTMGKNEERNYVKHYLEILGSVFWDRVQADEDLRKAWEDLPENVEFECLQVKEGRFETPLGLITQTIKRPNYSKMVVTVASEIHKAIKEDREPSFIKKSTVTDIFADCPPPSTWKPFIRTRKLKPGIYAHFNKEKNVLEFYHSSDKIGKQVLKAYDVDLKPVNGYEPGFLPVEGKWGPVEDKDFSISVTDKVEKLMSQQYVEEEGLVVSES